MDGQYVKETLSISKNEIAFHYSYYADDDDECKNELSAFSERKSYKLEGKLETNDMLVEAQKINLNGNEKRLVYLTPDAKRLILTQEGSGGYPSKFKISGNYVRRGADLSATVGEVKVAVLDHGGMNLKTGVKDSYEMNHDFSTAGFVPPGATDDEYPSEDSDYKWVWLRSNYADPNNYFLYHVSHQGEMGINDSNIKVPASWPITRHDVDGVWEDGDVITPLQKGHVYVLRRVDGGHAKIRVLNQPDPEDRNWPVLAEYALMD